VISQYGLLLKKNRRRILPFSKLKDLQQKLKFKTECQCSSQNVIGLFSNMDTIANFTFLMEPFFLSSCIEKLLNWKKVCFSTGGMVRCYWRI
jgi:hypothetical protein